MHDQGRSYGPTGETTTGGHAFSHNCVDWTYSPVPAYTTTVNHTDGSSSTYLKRERPHLYFDPTTGAPAVLFTGMQDIQQLHPQPPHCTWHNHNNKSLSGFCDPAFTHAQRIRAAAPSS